LVSCSSKDKSLSNATVTVVDEGGKDAGLDLQALGEMVKKSPNPAKLEEELNKPGSINNLDLNNDGKVDYIKVTESGSGNTRELKFLDQMPDSTDTEIATVKIDKGTDNQATMDISGNQAMYGDNYNYHSGFSVGEVLLMAYLFSPHMPYYSPWGFYHYPGYYRSYAPVPMVSYRRTVTTYNSHPTGTLAEPTHKRSTLSGASHSQKSFGTRDASKPVGSGGFGSHSTRNATSHSSSSSSHSSSRSSGRSFGRRH
jgi:hypothetical protein